MSSRQEEKEQRKRERLEREQAEQQAAKRKRLVQIIGGVVLGAAIVVAVVLVLAGRGGDADTGDLKAKAAAAGCELKSFPNAGQEHVTKKLTAADFKTNPPTSGNHNVTPAQDGLYAPGNEPEIQNWVHTLEHGRILFMYKPESPTTTIAAMQALFNENAQGKSAYHSVLMENNSKMQFAVAAVAWRHYLGCATYTPKAIDAMRAFREVYVDKAPEQIP